jgi:hypothetical protein
VANKAQHLRRDTFLSQYRVVVSSGCTKEGAVQAYNPNSSCEVQWTFQCNKPGFCPVRFKRGIGVLQSPGSMDTSVCERSTSRACQEMEVRQILRLQSVVLTYLVLAFVAEQASAGQVRNLYTVGASNRRFWIHTLPLL